MIQAFRNAFCVFCYNIAIWFIDNWVNKTVLFIIVLKLSWHVEKTFSLIGFTVERNMSKLESQNVATLFCSKDQIMTSTYWTGYEYITNFSNKKLSVSYQWQICHEKSVEYVIFEFWKCNFVKFLFWTRRIPMHRKGHI